MPELGLGPVAAGAAALIAGLAALLKAFFAWLTRRDELQATERKDIRDSTKLERLAAADDFRQREQRLFDRLEQEIKERKAALAEVEERLVEEQAHHRAELRRMGDEVRAARAEAADARRMEQRCIEENAALRRDYDRLAAENAQLRGLLDGVSQRVDRIEGAEPRGAEFGEG